MEQNKKVLLLGADGMLGSQLWAYLHRSGIDVTGTVRKTDQTLFDPLFAKTCHFGITATDFDAILRLIEKINPDCIVNCIGVIKHREKLHNTLEMLEVNSVLPHKIAQICAANNIRLIQISTDCVFSGKKGSYTLLDKPDPIDIYGMTKLLGEITDHPHVLTLRTSIIGKEQFNKFGLLEWALVQGGKINGFKNAIYSGTTTLELSSIVYTQIMMFPHAYGLYNVGGEKISKYELLQLIYEVYELQDVDVHPVYEPVIDRSLDTSVYDAKFSYTKKSWRQLLSELREFNIGGAF
jgi:dTDP-4-dehydrorhamnose reductase